MKEILKDFSRIYRLQDEFLMEKTDFLIVRQKKGERLEMEIKNGIMAIILTGEISYDVQSPMDARKHKRGRDVSAA